MRDFQNRLKTDFNRLKSISTSDNSKKQDNTFGVNGFRRKKKDKNDVETTEYAAGLATAVSKSTAKTVTYLMGHQLMGFEQDGQMYYFLHDALGSVRDIVNDQGLVVQSYEFDVQGNHLISPMSGGPASPKTFIGGLSVNDDTGDSGLYLMGHRHYDPSTQRFLSRDPIGFAGGLNLFSYAGNRASSAVDPTGLQALETAATVALVEPTPFGEVLFGGALTLWILFGAFNSDSDSGVGDVSSWTRAYFDPNNADSVVSRVNQLQRMSDAQGFRLSDPCSKQPVIGNKLDFLFGKATGRAHNIQRSRVMQSQLAKIGILDTPANRAFVELQLIATYNNPLSISNVNARGDGLAFTTRNSLLMGPGGGLRMQSTWLNNYLITIILQGG